MEPLFILHADDADEERQLQVTKLTVIPTIPFFLCAVNVTYFPLLLRGLLIQWMNGIATCRT